jgi:hypothetical protein
LKEIPFASLTNAIDMKIERVLTGFLIGLDWKGKLLDYRWEVVNPAFVRLRRPTLTIGVSLERKIT